MRLRKEPPAFIAPVVAAVLVLTLSILLKNIDRDTALVAAGISLVLVLGAFLSNAYALRHVQQQDRQAIYSLLAKVLPGSPDGGGLLRLEQLIAVEQTCSEAWVYAYDLAWETEGTGLPDVVRGNLERGVRYRYIVPPEKVVLGRVRRLQENCREVENAKDLIEFRVRPPDENLRLLQFGITIYNPSISSPLRPLEQCLAAFFPHYKSFGPEGGAVFVSLRGGETHQLQEGFIDLWTECEVVPWVST